MKESMKVKDMKLIIPNEKASIELLKIFMESLATQLDVDQNVKHCMISNISDAILNEMYINNNAKKFEINISFETNKVVIGISNKNKFEYFV